MLEEKQTLSYPNTPSATRPVLQVNDLPVHALPDQHILEPDEDTESGQKTWAQPSTADLDFMPESDSLRILENEPSHKIPDADLSKIKAELLATTLQQWNLLEDDVSVHM